MEQTAISQLLPGGFRDTAHTASRAQSEPWMTVNGREETSSDIRNVNFTNTACHRTRSDFEPTVFGSGGFSSMDQPISTWKPVTDLLWSYQPNGRPLGDATIPSLPVLSYGDHFLTNGSTNSGDHPLEREFGKKPKISRHSEANQGPRNVYHEMPGEQTEGSSEQSIKEMVFRCPYDHDSARNLHKAERISTGEPAHIAQESLLAPLEREILGDISSREMPSHLIIRCPTNGHYMEHTKSAKQRLNNKPDWLQAMHCYGHQQTPYVRQHATGDEEFTTAPQLSKALSVGTAHSVHQSLQRLEEPTVCTKESRKLGNLNDAILHHQNGSGGGYPYEGKDSNTTTRSITVIRLVETQTNGDRTKEWKCSQKPDQHAGPVKSHPATASTARKSSDGDRGGGTGANRTTQSEAVIIGNQKTKVASHKKRVLEKWVAGANSFTQSAVAEHMEIPEAEPQRGRDLCSSPYSAGSSAGQSPCDVQRPKWKQRFNWENFSSSLQAKRLVESRTALSEEKRPSTDNDGLLNTMFSKSAGASDAPEGTSTWKAEVTDDSSETNGSNSASNTSPTSEESDDKDRTGHAGGNKDACFTNKPTCDVCGKMFTRNTSLISHKRIHDGTRPYACEQCGRTFNQRGNLMRHMLTHGSSVKTHRCSYCNRMFSRLSNLRVHLRIHTNYRPHKCDMCEKSFHQKMDLKVHRFTHTGEKPHVCQKCGKSFKQATHLKYHVRIHSDVRMFTCEYCGKGFNQKGNLQAHINRHIGNRPHKCDICAKTFTLASTLNTHKRTHAAVKPFQCKFCSKAFYQKNALKTHYITSHPFTSGYCNM